MSRYTVSGINPGNGLCQGTQYQGLTLEMACVKVHTVTQYQGLTLEMACVKVHTVTQYQGLTLEMACVKVHTVTQYQGLTLEMSCVKVHTVTQYQGLTLEMSCVKVHTVTQYQGLTHVSWSWLRTAMDWWFGSNNWLEHYYLPNCRSLIARTTLDFSWSLTSGLLCLIFLTWHVLLCDPYEQCADLEYFVIYMSSVQICGMLCDPYEQRADLWNAL